MSANERTQVFFVGLSTTVVLLTVVAFLADRLMFQRFLGRINPILASLAIVLLGWVLLTTMESRGWFAIYRTGNLGRFLWPAVIAVVLALIMILIDRRAVLSEDLNILFPHSLLYYPVMGYAAEILFHVLPLFGLIMLSQLISSSSSVSGIIWPAIILIAILEPIFQILPLLGKHSTLSVALIAFHLFIFNVVQLSLFKRHDFVTMYSFRMVYYLIWHIVWGQLRIGILF